MQTFHRIFAYVKPYRGWFVFSAITLIFSALLGLVLPLVIGSVVDVVLVDGDLGQLNRIILFLFVIFIVQAIFSFMHRLSLAYVGERAITDIRIDLFTHLQHLSLRFYDDTRTGSIISRLTNDISQLQTAVTDNLMALLRQGITLIGAVILLFWLNWQLTLIILIGIPIITLTMVILGRQIRKASKQVQDALAESANVAEETTSGVRIVKSFAREQYEIGRYTNKVMDIFEAAMVKAKISAVLAPIIGFLAFTSITLTLWIGSYQVVNGNLTAGGLVAYLVYTMMVAAPIASLAGLYAQFQSALGATERVFTIMDTEPEIQNRPDAYPLPPVTGQVTFENVDFDYVPSAPVLHQVSFRAEPGQVVALVGPSGAGKSTLISLIPRFYDAADGRITIDGHDVRDVQLLSLRRQIGIVPQETTLFSDTVYENIRYGKLEATEAEIKAAAKAANAHDFILNELPDGYATMVGERGVKLSGGQRQRVAIARAILKDPRILILDEATSSLDSESEALVQEALERLMHGRTSFVIAHRLSTVLNADTILTLDRGRIVEQGSHNELILSQDGLYFRLYSMQFKESGD
ncbi:MAG TPA: ATP-binding cassette domain-containing protein [Anaerolineae bacterium]|nr:ATP-binding cassette domain-containing protein [Anaerolineae bacterium]